MKTQQYKNFLEIITSISKKDIKILLSTVLTESEQNDVGNRITMLKKLLLKKQAHHKIAAELSVGITTVALWQCRLKNMSDEQKRLLKTLFLL